MTPKQRIELACTRLGSAAVLQMCLDLLGGSLDVASMEALGGSATADWLDDPRNHYWPRVWGARGLLWNWDVRAAPAIDLALSDEHWRVREMAAKVVARHLLADAPVAPLVDDPNERVQAAARRAIASLVAAGT